MQNILKLFTYTLFIKNIQIVAFTIPDLLYIQCTFNTYC